MSDERTEEPTPKKLRDARKKGQVWRSRELGGALTLLAAAGVLSATAVRLVDTHWSTFRLAIDAVAGRIEGGPAGILEASVSLAASAIAPLLVALVVVGTLASLVQVGPLFAPEAIAWKPDRLNPIKGAKNLFSQKRLVELLKSIAIVAIVGGVAWMTLRQGLRSVIALAGSDALATLRGTGELVRTLLLRVGGAMLGVAALDVLYQRWRWMRDLRMTKDEVKREYKDAEGDPHIKQERERLRREIATHDVLENVRRADVLVVNPTHLAIALRFDVESDQNAPEVLAKGMDELAQRMIAAAREAGVPVMRDVPLAQGLFELEVGEEIPEALYEAVAAVLRAAWAEREAEEDLR
jgi:type III secretion YscU/HrpY family protein